MAVEESVQGCVCKWNMFNCVCVCVCVCACTLFVSSHLQQDDWENILGNCNKVCVFHKGFALCTCAFDKWSPFFCLPVYCAGFLHHPSEVFPVAGDIRMYRRDVYVNPTVNSLHAQTEGWYNRTNLPLDYHHWLQLCSRRWPWLPSVSV